MLGLTPLVAVGLGHHEQPLGLYLHAHLYIYIYTGQGAHVCVCIPTCKHEHGECVNVGAFEDLYKCIATHANPQVHIPSDSNCTCANPANVLTNNSMASLSSPVMFFRIWVGLFMSLEHVGVASRNSWELQVAM